MNVEVRMFASLIQYLPPGAKGKRARVQVPAGATVQDLAEHLGLGEVPCVVMVNGEQAHWQVRLSEGDVVSFFPPIAGGGLSGRGLC
ncbi:MAG TPA: MoaD/ThiS family protein [Armatimonadetes bacterium]|nr:MoaD/ThiS family protein [Armatimonadota bacterium]